MKEEAKKFEGKISKLSTKMNLDYSNPAYHITNSEQVDLNVLVEVLIDMIDNQIKVGKATELDNNQMGCQIVGNNLTEAIYNESSSAASFCDCYLEDLDYTCGDAYENSDEHPSLFPSNLLDDDGERCVF